MGKYKLEDILNEYVGGSRHGTINISYRDLQDAMDKVEADGDFVVREKRGPSGDGKSNREFEVVFIGAARGDDKPEEAGFTVYDYKFGFDPADEDYFDQEYPFSVGGSNKEAALKIAKYLLGNRVQGYMAKDKEILKGFDPKDINDVLFSFESNTDKDGEFKTSMGFNENLKEAAIKEPIKLKDALERYSFGEILDTAAEYYEEDDEKDVALLARQTAAKFRKMLDDFDGGVRKMDENMYIDDEEFEMEMGRSKKDSLKKEMMFHVNQLMDGNIDKNDFMNVVEDIMMDLGLKEVMGVDRKGRKKPESKSNMTKVNETSSEESIADYIIKYYTNPKTGEKVIDDDIVMAYFKTHPDYDELFDGTEEGMKDGLNDFQEFLLSNYDFPGSLDEDKILKEHFKRFM